jgi:hypothetical protein
MKYYLPETETELSFFIEDSCFYCKKYSMNPEKKQCEFLDKAASGFYNQKWLWRNGEPVCMAFRSKELKSVDKSENQLGLF